MYCTICYVSYIFFHVNFNCCISMLNSTYCDSILGKIILADWIDLDWAIHACLMLIAGHFSTRPCSLFAKNYFTIAYWFHFSTSTYKKVFILFFRLICNKACVYNQTWFYFMTTKIILGAPKVQFFLGAPIFLGHPRHHFREGW